MSCVIQVWLMTDLAISNNTAVYIFLGAVLVVILGGLVGVVIIKRKMTQEK